MITFKNLLRAQRGEEWAPPLMLLAFDPGQTTGWACFCRGELVAVGQTSKIDAVEKALPQLEDVFERIHPTLVIIEDYRVYAHKAKAHSWNSLHTPKLIGAIQALCSLRKIPVVMQMASSKQFVTDEKLKAWNMHNKGMRHALDAIRHGCYYLLFDKGAR